MKLTRRQKIAQQAKQRDYMAGRAADRALDPIREAIENGDLVVGPATQDEWRTVIHCGGNGPHMPCACRHEWGPVRFGGRICRFCGCGQTRTPAAQEPTP